MGTQKRAIYTQKRKKKLREKAAMAHAEEKLERLIEKYHRLVDERDALQEAYDTTFDERKMSSNIVWLAETIFPDIDDLQQFQRLCDVVIIAWNVSICGEDMLPDTVTPESLEILRILVARKKEAFPGDERFIADYWWDETPTGMELVVQGAFL